jgi:hypothetical protein
MENRRKELDLDGWTEVVARIASTSTDSMT